jgi:hypothetical protein
MACGSCIDPLSSALDATKRQAISGTKTFTRNASTFTPAPPSRSDHEIFFLARRCRGLGQAGYLNIELKGI